MVNTIEEIDLLFRDFFNSTCNFEFLRNQQKISYPLNIYEDNDNLTFEISVLKIKEDDIEIKTEDDILRIIYEKEKSKDDIKYLYKGLTSKSFNLGFKIPRAFELENTKASIKNGLLTIKIPKAEDKKPKSIKINKE